MASDSAFLAENLRWHNFGIYANIKNNIMQTTDITTLLLKAIDLELKEMLLADLKKYSSKQAA